MAIYARCIYLQYLCQNMTECKPSFLCRPYQSYVFHVFFIARPNHQIRNAAHSGVSEVVFFTKSCKWKKQRWEKWTTGRLLLENMCVWSSPTVRQCKIGDQEMRAQQEVKLLDVAWQCPDYTLLFPCSISFAESFVTCLRNKAHVYLLYLLTYVWWTKENPFKSF